MKPTTLKISYLQSGQSLFRDSAPILLSENSTLLCHNLRNRGEGVLRRVNPPATVATIGGTPILADRREEGYFMLRQEDDGSIIVDGFLDMENSRYTSIQKNLGSVGIRVKRAQAAGEYVVLLLADGTLAYLLYERVEKTYTLLGPLPNFPAPSATVTDSTELTSTIEATDFRTPLPDIRAGLDDPAREALGKSLAEAWKNLRRRAADAGVWLQPVEVRLVYRLNDGTIFHISEAQRIGRNWQCGERAELLPAFDSKGNVTGASSGSLSATGYRIAISEKDFGLQLWEKVIGAIEVWVTEESDPVDSGSLPITGVNTGASGNVILAQLRMRPDASLDAALSASPSGIAARWSPGEEPGVIASSPTILYNLDAALLMTEEMNEERIADICCHDGFLHIASSDSLVTCRRDNPFRKQSATPGDWSDVRTMTAQIWGGGAYTRQIVYIATGKGVSALAHDREGNHTNCRIISYYAPISKDFTAVAGRWVYMLLDNGSLTRFSGTKSEKILTGVEGCGALVYSERFSELTLVPSIPQSHCLVLGPGMLNDVFTRDRFELRGVTGTNNLYMRELSNGLVEIISPDSEEEQPEGTADWMGCQTSPSGKGLWLTLECGVAGENVDARLRLGEADPTPGKTADPQSLVMIRLQGSPHGLLRFNVRPGALRRGILQSRGHLHARLTGRFDMFYNISLNSAGLC